jgi:predicted transcriptional regulator
VFFYIPSNKFYKKGSEQMTLKQARLASGLRTGFICHKLGISTTYIYLMENNVTPVPYERQMQFIKLYGTNDIKF